VQVCKVLLDAAGTNFRLKLLQNAQKGQVGTDDGTSIRYKPSNRGFVSHGDGVV
jgi:hypothetical protein